MSSYLTEQQSGSNEIIHVKRPTEHIARSPQTLATATRNHNLLSTIPHLLRIVQKPLLPESHVSPPDWDMCMPLSEVTILASTAFPPWSMGSSHIPYGNPGQRAVLQVPSFILVSLLHTERVWKGLFTHQLWSLVTEQWSHMPNYVRSIIINCPSTLWAL